MLKAINLKIKKSPRTSFLEFYGRRNRAMCCTPNYCVSNKQCGFVVINAAVLDPSQVVD